MKFKVGDRLRCIRSARHGRDFAIVRGRLYKVVGYYTDGCVFVDDIPFAWFEHNFSKKMQQRVDAGPRTL